MTEESIYEGIDTDKAEAMVEEFEAKLGEAVELLEGLNDPYLEAYVLNRLRSTGYGDMHGSIPDMVREHILGS